jgi:hypothetical protein
MVLFEHLKTNEGLMNKQSVQMFYLIFEYFLFDCSIFISGKSDRRVLGSHEPAH